MNPKTLHRLPVENKGLGWLLFLILSLIWGSSFILMKLGLQSLTPYQVASIRIGSAGIVLLPFARNAFRQIPKEKIFPVLVSGLAGSFFPAYLFCLAETRIDSSLAAILNALTPLFAVLAGVLFFDLKVSPKKILGVLTGFVGLVLLPLVAKKQINFANIEYALLILAATICYGINVNLVGRYLGQISSLRVVSLSFSFLIIPSICILWANGYFQLALLTRGLVLSTAAASVLGIGGTAIATTLFYLLIKRTGAVFASLVTYGVPLVALLWGLLAGESISFPEILCLILILAGVALANR